MTEPSKPKLKRRGRNEGSIYQRADKMWCATLQDHDGLTAQRHVVYGRTRREVADKLTQMLQKKAEARPLLDSSMRLDDYLEQWLTDVAALRCRPSTMASYTHTVRYHLSPALGHIRLDRLTPVDVRRFILAKRKETGRLGKPHSPTSIRYMHSVLRNALNDAMRDELISRNVVQLVRAPTDSESDYVPQYLTFEQSAALLAAAKGNRLEALYRLAITGGLRRGELIALRWDDLSLDDGEIWVRRTVIRQTGGGLVESEPKSKNSKRRLLIGPVMVDALRKHHELQTAERLALGDEWVLTGRVFTSPIGTTLDPSNLVRDYHELLDAAGIPRIRFHALRHTCATLLLAEGVALEVIADRLGHGDIRVTSQVYAHVIDKSRVRAADRLDSVFD